MQYRKLVLASRVKRYEILTVSHEYFNNLCVFLNSSLLENTVAYRYKIVCLIRVFFLAQTEVGSLFVVKLLSSKFPLFSAW